MRLFFLLLIWLSIFFSIASANDKVLTEDKLTSILEKQDMKFKHFKETTELTLKHELETTKKSVDETNTYIGYVNNRIDNISGSVDRFAILTTFFGVLITIIVFFFSFKSNSEARQTVEDWLEENGDDFVRKEVQPIKESFDKMISDMQKEMDSFKKKSNEEIKKLKAQLEEKGNEAIENLSYTIINTNTSDIELSIKDKEYFEYQIKIIKSKPLKQRSFQDYKTMILFFIANKEHNKATELINKLLKKDYYSSIEIGMLYYFKGLNAYKAIKNREALEYLDKSIELSPKLGNSYTLKAKIYGFLRKDYKKQKELASIALQLDKNNYDAYINLAFSTIEKAYSENKFELYIEAEKYSKDAIEINPDLQIAYAITGFIYLLQNEYLEAKKWYLLSFERNTREWGYYDLFRIYLFLEEPFPKTLEEQYFKDYNKNDSEEFALYKMLKILFNIIDNNHIDKEKIKAMVSQWKDNCNKLKYYYLELEALKSWVDKKLDINIKENLNYALKLFDEHRIK